MRVELGNFYRDASNPVWRSFIANAGPRPTTVDDLLRSMWLMRLDSGNYAHTDSGDKEA